MIVTKSNNIYITCNLLRSRNKLELIARVINYLKGLVNAITAKESIADKDINAERG